MTTTRTTLLLSAFLVSCSGGGDKPATPVPVQTAGTAATGSPKATAKPGTNREPAITEVKVTTLGGVIDNAHPSRDDILEARASTSDPDGDGVLVDYTWEVNGKQVPGAVGDRLQPTQGKFKKGDTVSAIAKARDTRGLENPNASKGSIVIRNTPPQIVSKPTSLMSYQLSATDADGDKLKFYLERPVPGFVISSDGQLSFNAAAGKAAEGQQLVIVAYDEDKATARQSITVHF